MRPSISQRVSGLLKSFSPRSRVERALAEREAQLLEAQEALRVSEERLRLAFIGAELGSWHWDFRTGEVVWSDLTRTMFGFPEAVPITFEGVMASIHPEDREKVRTALQRAIEERRDYDKELRVVRPDGTLRWISARGRAYCDARGTPVRMEGVVQDITSKKQAEEALRASEERLRRLADAVPHLIWQLDTKGNLVYANQRWRDYFGRSTLRHNEWHEVLDEQESGRAPLRLATVLDPKSPGRTDIYKVRGRDGVSRWYSHRTVPICDSAGNLLYVVGTSTDVESLVKAQELASESEARFEQLAEAMPHLVWQFKADGALLYANERYHNYFGHYPTNAYDWPKVVHPDDAPNTLSEWTERAKEGGGELVYEARLRRKDGQYRWFVNRVVPVRDGAGALVHLVGTSTDVEDVKMAEAALHESQKRLELAIEAAKIALWDLHLDTQCMVFSSEWKRQLGYQDHEIQNRAEEWTSRVHPDDWPRVQALVRAIMESAIQRCSVEFRMRHKDGSYRSFLTSTIAVPNAHGKPERLIGCNIDLTESKRLEEELRQAQKMEAVGRLAGGVAHDFNNLLTVILGHTSLIQAYRELPSGVAEAVRGISLAAERAASLTAQLLAFGRRQVMQSHVLDLSELVSDVLKMLRRVLGDDIVLQFEHTRTGMYVRGDTSMLTQVLLNLAVNARDAMPHGGQLRIRTALEPLDPCVAQDEHRDEALWVCLSVSDTGVGIPESLLPHIFEPFVTSKEVGKGTGLGLSTVYGIVRQHQGYVTVESELDRGTTFKVFLPRAEAPVRARVEAPAETRPRGRGELILLVEDDQSVRAVLNDILLQHGYRVALARTGQEALSTWSEHGDEVDLVLTDAVMPGGITGVEVLESLRAKKPTLKAILSSGYSPELVNNGASTICASFLQKPFSADELLCRIRHVLDLP